MLQVITSVSCNRLILNLHGSILSTSENNSPATVELSTFRVANQDELTGQGSMSEQVKSSVTHSTLVV